jgi:hypothetical protein
LTAVEESESVIEANHNTEATSDICTNSSLTNDKQTTTSEAMSINSLPTTEELNCINVSPNPGTNIVFVQPSVVSELNDIPLSAIIRPFTPEFIEETESPISEPPLPLSPILSHKCFDTSPTVYDFAKTASIKNINHSKIMYVVSKIWKVRCPECTEELQITDDCVEYAFALLQYNEKTYILIKIKGCFNELFLIPADDLKQSCPKTYTNFVNDTKEYFDTLGDLGMAIDEKKNIIASYHDNTRFQNNDKDTFQNTTEQVSSEIKKKVARDIVELFLLELQFGIGSYKFYLDP